MGLKTGCKVPGTKEELSAPSLVPGERKDHPPTPSPGRDPLLCTHRHFPGVHGGLPGRNQGTCPFATEHQRPDAGRVLGELFPQPHFLEVKPVALAGRWRGISCARGSWNLTRALGLVSMAAADLLLGPPPSLADFRLGAGRRGTEQAVVGAGSPQATA